jgi:hypothetical protein
MKLRVQIEEMLIMCIVATRTWGGGGQWNLKVDDQKF